MRWSLVLLAACGSSASPPKSPEPIAAAPPSVDAAPVAPPATPESPDVIARGATLFEQRGCKTCHDPGVGVRPIGAPLQGVWGTQVALVDGSSVLVDERYVRESILEPATKLRVGFDNVMPAFPIFNEREMADLVAYIRSLR